MAKKENKRIRVLYTNGEDTYVLYQLTHTGDDLYHGTPGWDQSNTYHASGVKHTKTKEGEYTGRNKEAPLKEVTHRQLICVGMYNTAKHFEGTSKFSTPSGKQVDGSIIIDSRTLPEGELLSVSIGLISSSNLQMLQNMLSVHKLGIPGATQPLSVLLYTEVEPWVYAIVYHGKSVAVG